MSSRIIRKWLGRLSRHFLSELPRPRGNGGTGLYTPPNSGGGTAVVRAAATVNGVTLSRTAKVTLLPPPVIASVSAGPGPVTGCTAALKVVAFNPGGGSLSYVWRVVAAPAGAPPPALSAAGAATATATFFQAGTYTFQVTVTNQKGSVTVAAVSVTVHSMPSSLLVTPATATVPRGRLGRSEGLHHRVTEGAKKQKREEKSKGAGQGADCLTPFSLLCLLCALCDSVVQSFRTLLARFSP